MQRPATSTRVGMGATLVALIVTSCGGGDPISMPPAEDLPAPTFVTLPADLADSIQLDAIDDRDTAGLPHGIESPTTESLGPALAAYLELPDAQTNLTGLLIDDYAVHLSYYQGGIPGRSVTAIYRLPRDDDPDREPTLDISEPTFGDRPTFSIEHLDPAVPARLVAALSDRFPAAAVDWIQVASPESGFGAVWRLTLVDARGQLAEITADFDGAIVAVSVD